MHPSRSALRGRLAAATALALACGASVLLPAPAHANSLVGQAGVVVSADPLIGTCSGGGHAERQTTIVSSGTVSRSAALDGTVTDSADAADITTWASSARLSVVTQTGVPSMSISGSLAGSVDAQQNDASDCAVAVQGGAVAIALLELDSSGWVTFNLSHPDGTVGVFALMDTSTMQLIHQGFDQEDRTSAVWVAAGRYQVQLGAQMVLDDDSTTTAARTASGLVSGSVRYVPAGGATATQAGSGSAYLRLGNGVNCTDRQVLGVLTSKAKALRSATFTVNKSLQRTVKNPSPGSAVVLRSAAPTSRTSVKAVLVTKKGKKLSVSRSYLACS